MTDSGFPGLAQEALRRFGVFRFRALGDSMRPCIRDGSIVTIAPCSGAVQVGDVVAVRIGQRLVIHRAVVSEALTVTTAGDSNRKVDPATDMHDVLGLITRVEWPNGWEMNLRTPLARGLGWFIALGSRHRLGVGCRQSQD